MILASRHSRNLLRGLAGLALLLAAEAATAALPTTPPELILFNGEIMTMEPALPHAKALAVREGLIVAVGSDRQVRLLAGPATRVIDLKGRTVVPGLIDTHMHAIRGGQSYSFETYWYDHTSLMTALQALKLEAERRGPGKWVAVVGAWHPDQFRERRPPTAADLDAIAPDNPAFVQFLYNYALVNKRGIEVLGLDSGTAMPAGLVAERGSDGKATGKLTGGIGPLSAVFARIGASQPIDRRESLRQFFSELNRLGVTAVIDPAAGDFSAYNPIFSLWRARALTVRVGYRAPAGAREKEEQWFKSALAFLPPGFGDEMLRFVGMGEILVGGMNDGIQQGPGFVSTQEAREELFKVATFAAERGYSVEIHAYTEDAANQILDVFEEVAKKHSIRELRWIITHINTGHASTFARMKNLGIAYGVQMGPYFEADAVLAANGKALAEVAPPTRFALLHDVKVVGGTDSTRIGQINVWRAIEYHVSGRSAGGTLQRTADHLLSREEALRLYTADAAWATFDESRRGTLSRGKAADLVVLDAPYFKVPVNCIHTLRSVMTLVAGKVVHEGEPAMRRKTRNGAQRQSCANEAEPLTFPSSGHAH